MIAAMTWRCLLASSLFSMDRLGFVRDINPTTARRWNAVDTLGPLASPEPTPLAA
jgi:hypothetical protein